MPTLPIVTPLVRIMFAGLLCLAQQPSTSTLTGTVYDNSGAVVAGAIATATNDATGVAQKQVTGEVYRVVQFVVKAIF